jgi:K+-transporting ATPase ATPase C chain
MFKHIRPAFATLALMTLITGIAYPLSVTAVAQLAFTAQANGSLVRDEAGQVRGSALLAQSFEGQEWFQPRPSAAGYATVASGASNLAPSNPMLTEYVRDHARRWNGTAERPVPIELVTASGSGLDPHLSVGAARFQATRIAEGRGISPERLNRLIDAHVVAPLIGPAVVNVLALNKALADNSRPDSDE